MKFFNGLRVYGDVNFRDKNCKHENAEQRTFISDMKSTHPLRDILQHIIIHVDNEGERTGDKAKKLKAKGSLVKGVSDIIGIGNPMLVMELKRKDHTTSVYQPRQEEFLKIAHQAGCFTCVALGYEGANQALEEWLKLDPLGLNK